jgi:hypothetical protein
MYDSMMVTHPADSHHQVVMECAQEPEVIENSQLVHKMVDISVFYLTEDVCSSQVICDVCNIQPHLIFVHECT